MSSKLEIHRCSSRRDFEIAKVLSKDYMLWLGMDLSFQNVSKEFENFDNMYGSNSGAFIYATINNQVVGGVGCRYFKEGICEMKRLFIYEKFQGNGYGKKLAEIILQEAKSLGYKEMYLDTVSRLEKANKMYENIGFRDIEAYYYNPDITARFMAITL